MAFDRCSLESWNPSASSARQQQIIAGRTPQSFSGRRAPREFLTNRNEPQPSFMEDFCSNALFLAQNTQQQVFGANVQMIQPLCFFVSVSQDSFALVGKRQIY